MKNQKNRHDYRILTPDTDQAPDPEPSDLSAHDKAVQELQRLLACYQIATVDDKKVVWAVLNKYAQYINE